MYRTIQNFCPERRRKTSENLVSRAENHSEHHQQQLSRFYAIKVSNMLKVISELERTEATFYILNKLRGRF